MANWHFILFGQLTADGPNGSIADFRDVNAKGLLALLVLFPGGRSRDWLGEALWPGELQETQRSRLRRAKFDVGDDLKDKSLVAKKGNNFLTLTGGWTSDITEWRREASAAILETNASYRADRLEALLGTGLPQLLPGLFGEWLEQARREWESDLEKTIRTLIQALYEIRRYERAEYWIGVFEKRFPELDPPDIPDPVALDGDSFIGRREEYLFLRQWLKAKQRSERLVTITGQGGIGKTRLVLEASSGIALLFVALAECVEAWHIWEALRIALGLGPVESPEEMVITQLNEPDAPRILLLDNLEQLGEQARLVVHSLLVRCPAVSILATSQRRLGLAGEREIALIPLTRRHSFDLFLTRARRERADFAAYPDAERRVWEICDLLEGIPLAIELAAARAYLLGPAQMHRLLENALSFLVTRRQELPERQRSIRSVFDWSVSLLSPSARQTLGQLAVFRGGCSPEAVLCVCGRDSLDDLDELIAMSLLQLRFLENETARYSLLSLVCEYAKEHIGNSEEVISAHALYYSDISGHGLSGDFLKDWQFMKDFLFYEVYNIRDTIHWLSAQGDVKNLYKLMDRISVHCIELGYWSESTLIFSALETVELEPEQKIRYLGFSGALKRRCGDYSSARLLWEKRLELCCQINDRLRIVDTSMDLGHMEYELGNYENAKLLLDFACEESDKCEFVGLMAESNVLRAQLACCENDNLILNNCCNLVEGILSDGKCSFREMLFVYHILSEVYYKIEKYDKCKNIAKKAMNLAIDQGMYYHVAVIAQVIENILKDGVALRVALAIHCALGSGRRDSVIRTWKAFAEAQGRESWSMSIKDFDWKAESYLLAESL